MNLLKKRRIFFLLAALSISVFGAYFYFKNSGEKITYITEEVRENNVQKVVNASGEVKAIELVTVGAQVSGKVEKLHVSIGQKVERGDLIAEIDSTTQQNDVNINKAKLNSYKAQLASAKITLEIAKKQYERMLALEKSDAVAVEEIEDFKDTYESAKSKVTEVEALIEETEISLSTAETNLGYTRITAPLSGVVVCVSVKQGQTVNAAMDTPAIVQIADPNRMEILLEISEGDIYDIKSGARVDYSILADLNKVYHTTLKSIDPGLTLLTNGEYDDGTDSSEAIYYYGRLEVPNEDGKLRIGMTMQSVIYVSSAENALTVASVAVKGGGDAKYVEVLTESGVEKRDISTGISDGLNVVVLKGLKAGEKVVIAELSSSEITSKTSKFAPPSAF